MITIAKKLLIIISALICSLILLLSVSFNNHFYFGPPHETKKPQTSADVHDTSSYPKDTSAPPDTTAPPNTTSISEDWPPVLPEKYDPIDISGTISTSTGTSLSLIIEWSAKRGEGERGLLVSTNVYLEHDQLFIGKKEFCLVSINGEIEKFVCPAISENTAGPHRSLLHSFSRVIEFGKDEEVVLELEAKMYIYVLYSDTVIDCLHAKGRINISDEVLSLPTSAKLNVKNIMQNPGLPNGCEITSLTILLNYLGFDIDKFTMCDEYLDIGPVGFTSYYKANIGNPRSDYSYGCYSPVIYNAAKKYIDENAAPYTASDLTGRDISEIYAQVAAGRPVVVWTTMDINTAPYNIISWEIDGERIYWKHPLHCVVLTGYDKEKNRVYISDPIVGNVSRNMSLFELRWRQMGSQAVTLVGAP